MNSGIHASGGPQVSIVICTDGRSAALANTLRCLQYLDGPGFEVCVIRGPTEDGIDQVLANWSGHLKVGQNPQRNLSISRNIGISLASGEIVAFIDDDGLPEPAWLEQIVAAFADPKVGGAGGLVMNHTGSAVQYHYASADRLGNADIGRTGPAEEYNFPYSFNFPYVQGTNSAFRRAALLEVCGFDEEFDFYLDETDLCCRLVDAGWKIRQLPNAIVHHKFLPSAIRTADRVTRTLYSVLKNKLYFSIINNRGHYSLAQVVADMEVFVQLHEDQLRRHVEAGRLQPGDLDAYRRDVERSWAVGMERGISGQRRLMSPDLAIASVGISPSFPRLLPPSGRRVFVFITQEYPPDKLGGIGRYIHQLARAIAGLGHHVHVVTVGEGHDRVDFEEGMWVHRVPSRETIGSPPAGLPARIWARAKTALEVVYDIATRQTLTAVYAPIWDCEGAAVLLDGKFPLVTGLQTTLKFWLDSHPHIARDAIFQKEFARPMLEMESRLLQESDGIHAISKAIAVEISKAYHVELEPPRTQVAPLGLDDWTGSLEIPARSHADDEIRILFVGRLEGRKGIDVLLKVIPRILLRHPTVSFDLVGNDQIVGPEGITYRQSFEALVSDEVSARVCFHGEVSDDQLRGFYRSCDIFVAPSRFESFGLILVEAMMYGKPTVACRVGGMVEVAEENRSALLAEGGDDVSLEACLERLIEDPALRQAFGLAARQRFETHFSAQRMAENVVDLLMAASGQILADANRPAS